AETFNSEIILKRAFMLLEDAEWQKADELLERILNQNPECAEAYLGKLMIDLKVNKRENLATVNEPFKYNNNNYQKIMRYCDDALRDEKKTYTNSVLDRIIDEKYKNAVNRMKSRSIDEITAAEKIFGELKGYRDSGSLANECREMKKQIVRDERVVTIVWGIFLLIIFSLLVFIAAK
ncbi:MAG: hypothetical protein KH216_07190, partial [Clostridiales bacterium]|nr:hypothetical protein [Clostridiales bacterium]